MRAHLAAGRMDENQYWATHQLSQSGLDEIRGRIAFRSLRRDSVMTQSFPQTHGTNSWLKSTRRFQNEAS
jgi:hypothetical protein